MSKFNPQPHEDSEIHPAMPAELKHKPVEPEDETEDIALEIDPEITCWCGAKGKFSELCDTSVFGQGCAGTGMLDCLCGGDQCVCHNHGEVECPGCADCEGDDEYD